MGVQPVGQWTGVMPLEGQRLEEMHLKLVKHRII